MPRTDAQFEQMRVESRERILDAALRLFARHGYDATSVRMIAVEAQVAQGLLYNYFDGKRALLHAIVDRGMGDVQASFDLAAGGTTPAARLERLIRGALALVRENLAFWRLTYQLRMQPGVLDGSDEHGRQGSEAIRRRLEALLRAAGTPAPATQARLLFAAIDGVAQHFAMEPEAYPLDEVAEALVQRFVAPAPDVRARREKGRKS